MKKRFLVLALVAAASVVIVVRVSRGRAEPPPVAGMRMSELDQRDLTIAAWRRVVDYDTTSAMGLGMLSALYLQRGRESGEYADYLHAEDFARRSLAERVNRNAKTYITLASALLAQHRFSEARDAARLAAASDPYVPSFKATLGEIELELGDYAGAKATFDSLGADRRQLSIAPRVARFAELTGYTDFARQLLIATRDSAASHAEIPKEQQAWFNLRVGDIEMRNGRIDRAETAFRAGLAIEPSDYRLLAALSRLELVRGRPQSAIPYGERAIATMLDPATLGTLSDAYLAIGDSAKSADYAKTLEVVVAGQPGAYHRAWSLFLLDHDRRTAEVLAKTQIELESRTDVYGYDLLAWALHKQRRDVEAAHAMTNALAQHTKDAIIFYHAGMIERALGRNAEAHWYLSHALSVNPYFHATQPNVARAVLDSLNAKR
ncbi:MAG: tetratricopeptide repeat protein [Gemmatimonadaceae bacterium]